MADDPDSGSTAAFAVSARDAARNVTELWRLHAEFENSVMFVCLDLADETRPDKKGKLAQMFHEILGPKPLYDPKEIDTYYKKVEMEMYRKFYEPSAYRVRTTKPEGYWNEKTVVSIAGLPDSVAKRIMKLSTVPTLEFAVRNWNLRDVQKRELAYQRGFKM